MIFYFEIELFDNVLCWISRIFLTISKTMKLIFFKKNRLICNEIEIVVKNCENSFDWYVTWVLKIFRKTKLSRNVINTLLLMFRFYFFLLFVVFSFNMKISRNDQFVSMKLVKKLFVNKMIEKICWMKDLFFHFNESCI